MIYNPFPKYVKRAGIAAPAGPPDRKKLEKALRLMEKLGIEAVPGSNVFAGSSASYLSADAEKRASDLHKFWLDKSIDIIFCARGGFGSMHLLPLLDWEIMKSRELPLLGFSDITALHLTMLKKKVGVPITSYSAVELDNITKDEYTSKMLKKALSSSKKLAALPFPKGCKISIIKPGKAKGPAIPANLATLASILGTEFMPDLEGCVLLLEDISEPVYKLDRYLTQLRLSGILSKISGLIFCGFKDCGKAGERARLFKETAQYVNGPTLSGFPFGHKLPFAAIICGSDIEIKENGKIFL
jgi:muramoyltetrapeptide carboxypeptidase